MKVIVVLLLAVSFSLGGALYATASPSSLPGQVYDLRVKVKQLRLRVDAVTTHLADVECRTQFNEHAIFLLARGEPLGDVRLCQVG